MVSAAALAGCLEAVSAAAALVGWLEAVSAAAALAHALQDAVSPRRFVQASGAAATQSPAGHSPIPTLTHSDAIA